MSEWIKVQDKLPINADICIILLKNNIIELGSYIPAQYEKNGNSYISLNPRWNIPLHWQEVTHWMILPEFPL